jgi:hypothetical protein
MAQISIDNVIAWEGVAAQLFALGVKSFATVRAAMQDAGADDATIAALEPKWAALHADVKRAAGL